MVSEAIFVTNRGYICIEKWSQILVSGIGSAHSESEEKSLFKLWSLESGFLMRKREENDFFSKICNNSILRFTYLKSAQNV